MHKWGIVASAALVFLVSTVSDLFATTWYVKPNGTGDVPTIQAGIEAAQHGDTILCAPGTYSWSNQGTGTPHGMLYILRGSADMTIRSEAGPEVTFLDAQSQGRVMFFQGETELTVEGFTFMRGVAPALGNFVGGGFAAHLSSPVLRNCIFLDNWGSQGGAYWYGGVGAPQLIDCVFERNTGDYGGAIFLINSPGDARVTNCVLRNNSATLGGGGLFTYNFFVTVEGCTFVGNDAPSGGAMTFQNSYPNLVTQCTISGNTATQGGGIRVEGSTTLSVEASIIAFGIGGAVSVDATSSMSLSCSDLFGNTGGDWTGPIAGQLGVNGNFSLDPEFCAGEFTLDRDSPCAPDNHPNGDACGRIGAHDVNCGSVATDHRTWGAVKALYRNH